MGHERLGEFEELTLLAVRALGKATYGVAVLQFVEEATGRKVSIGATYAALDRLEAKGFVRSVMSAPEAVRGGRRKRMFTMTPAGLRAALELRRVRERIWRAIEQQS